MVSHVFLQVSNTREASYLWVNIVRIGARIPLSIYEIFVYASISRSQVNASSISWNV